MNLLSNRIINEAMKGSLYRNINEATGFFISGKCLNSDTREVRVDTPVPEVTFAIFSG